jgi:hypothetical protein
MKMKVLIIETPTTVGNRVFESLLTEDGNDVVSSESLPDDFGRCDVLIFNGVPTHALLADGRDAQLIDFIHSGKGCVAIHDSIAPVASHVTLLGVMGLQPAWDGLTVEQRPDSIVQLTLHLALGDPSNPMARFPVHPCTTKPIHPIVAGLRSFDIADEFWAMNTTSDVIPLLYAEVEDRFPVQQRLRQRTCVAGCRNAGKGRCAFIVLGHYRETYQHPRFRMVLERAALWAGKRINGSRYAYDIFISYSSKDQNKADEFQRAAKRKGLRCFLAPRQLGGGDKWTETIRKALLSSREMCILASKTALTSEWVTTEWGAAWALRRRLTPILLGSKPRLLPDRLKQFQAVDFCDIQRYLQAAKKRAEQDET